MENVKELLDGLIQIRVSDTLLADAIELYAEQAFCDEEERERLIEKYSGDLYRPIIRKAMLDVLVAVVAAHKIHQDEVFSIIVNMLAIAPQDDAVRQMKLAMLRKIVDDATSDMNGLQEKQFRQRIERVERIWARACPPLKQACALAAPPLQRAPGGTLCTLQVGARVLSYQLKRSSRRTIGFTVNAAGLTITAPRRVTLAELEKAIADKQKWIFAKLAAWQHHAEQNARPPIAWGDGAQLPYLGRTIAVALQSASGAPEFDASAGRLALGLSGHAHAQQIKDCVRGWLQSAAQCLFTERLNLYAQRLGVNYCAFKLSTAITRWGSCSSNGKIRLNWRLIHLPLSIIDYVVVHELAHLREMNHGPRFWQTVASIFPEFREARRALRQLLPEQLPAF